MFSSKEYEVIEKMLSEHKKQPNGYSNFILKIFIVSKCSDSDKFNIW